MATSQPELNGTVAVVVGGSAGIGKATASRLAGSGATVLCIARGAERLARAVAEIGGDTHGLVCDATDPTAVRKTFADIERQHGGIDKLFNVLGTARPALVEDASDDDIDVVVGTNLLASIYTTRAAIPVLRRRGGGDIVNVSSEVTIDLFPWMTLYATAKAGLEMFTRSMTKELKSDDIRVSLFIAGRTRTEFTIGDQPEDRLAAMRRAWDDDGCMRRVAGTEQMEPDWVAEALVFAATRPAGQMIDVIQVRSFS